MRELKQELRLEVDKEGMVSCENYRISEPIPTPVNHCYGCHHFISEQGDEITEKRYILCREKRI